MFKYWDVREKLFKEEIEKKRNYYSDKICSFLSENTMEIQHFFANHRFILGTLEPREAQIFSMYFGLDGQPMTQRQIGKEFNISGQRVSELLKKVYRKLRHPHCVQLIVWFDDKKLGFDGDYKQLDFEQLDDLLKQKQNKQFDIEHKIRLTPEEREIENLIYTILSVPYSKLDSRFDQKLTIGEILQTSFEDLEKMGNSILFKFVDKIHSIGLRFQWEDEYEQDWLNKCVANIKTIGIDKIKEIFEIVYINEIKYSSYKTFNQLMETTLEELDISVRSFNCLKRAGMDTIADVVVKSEEDLIKVKNMGRRSVEEIIAKVRSFGLDIRPENMSQDKWMVQIRTKLGLSPYDAEQINAIAESEDKQNISEDKFNQVLQTTILDLDLSVRSYNCLRYAGIETVKDLVVKTREQLLKVRNLGRRCIDEIDEKVQSLGLDIRHDDFISEDEWLEILKSCFDVKQNTNSSVKHESEINAKQQSKLDAMQNVDLEIKQSNTNEPIDLDINEVPEKYRKTYAIGASEIAKQGLKQNSKRFVSKAIQNYDALEIKTDKPLPKIKLGTPSIAEQDIINKIAETIETKTSTNNRLIGRMIENKTETIEHLRKKDLLVLETITKDISLIYDLEESFVNKYRSELIKIVLADTKLDVDSRFNLIELINNPNKFTL